MKQTRAPIEPELIEIKGGFFTMGSDSGKDDERPAHEVWVDPFMLARYTVTNEDYGVFLKSSQYPVTPPFMQEEHFKHPMQPVVGVSWLDAVAYCEWLTRFTDRKYRLPTEAEWEFAARSGSARSQYPWGTRKWEEMPELHTRFVNGPEQIGSFEPNPLGLHELGMNVHEWCADKNYYYYSTPWNPPGAQEGTRRASRGGSWRHHVKITRCAARSSLPPGLRYSDYGFRVAAEAPTPPQCPR
jgi:sulfatase modifying factor 1